MFIAIDVFMNLTTKKIVFSRKWISYTHHRWPKKDWKRGKELNLHTLRHCVDADEFVCFSEKHLYRVICTRTCVWAVKRDYMNTQKKKMKNRVRKTIKKFSFYAVNRDRINAQEKTVQSRFERMSNEQKRWKATVFPVFVA